VWTPGPPSGDPSTYGSPSTRHPSTPRHLGQCELAVPAGTSYFVGAQAQSGEQKVSVGVADPRRARHKIYAHAGSGHVRVVYS